MSEIVKECGTIAQRQFALIVDFETKAIVKFTGKNVGTI
jgi:hypothetical protein